MSTFIKSFIVLYVLMIFAYAGNIASIGVLETKKLSDEKSAVIIDVRESAELKSGMIKGAMFLPMSEMINDRKLFDSTVLALPKDKAIIVYCASGKRSAIVGSELEKKGYRVFNMGKFIDWKNAGLPIEIKE
jgi:rhodanese-related sulfurtransferase